MSSMTNSVMAATTRWDEQLKTSIGEWDLYSKTNDQKSPALLRSEEAINQYLSDDPFSKIPDVGDNAYQPTDLGYLDNDYVATENVSDTSYQPVESNLFDQYVQDLSNDL